MIEFSGIENPFKKDCICSLLRLLSKFIISSFSAAEPEIYKIVKLTRNASIKSQETYVDPYKSKEADVDTEPDTEQEEKKEADVTGENH